MRPGKHHFAFLRAIAEGLPLREAAVRYLGVEHASAAAAAGREAIDMVRAVARRKGDTAWRLIGVEIEGNDTPTCRPPLDEWAAAEGLEDWPQAELSALYEERFGAANDGALRRARRNARLRARRLALLAQLEREALAPPSTGDLLAGWIEPKYATQLSAQGVLTIADLQARIALGGRWWSGLHAVGAKKAARLAAHVEQLVGEPAQPGWPVAIAASELAALSGRNGANRLRGVSSAAAIAAEDDHAAIEEWIVARTAKGGPAAVQYRREAERFLLWCVLERRKALSDATANDCTAYMEFLAAVPTRWITRKKVRRMTPGWAPFRGPLKVDSQRLAVSVVTALFNWLVTVGYLARNPWMLVNRRIGDDADAGEDDDIASRAFTPEAWAALRDELERRPESPSTARLRWLCIFVEATGLRPAELLGAQRRHFRRRPLGWVLRVHGKGQRNRTVPVPTSAMQETRAYFATRGLDFDEGDSTAPLLASLVDPHKGITHSALHQTFTCFVRQALAHSRLSTADREHAEQASCHWLRHTHATRAAERGVDDDVLQENMGHADRRMTAGYYRAQVDRRQRQMEAAFPPAEPQ